MDLTILISSAGRRVALLQAFRRSLTQLGVKGRIIACDRQPALSAACSFADASFVVPPIASPEWSQAVTDLCRIEGVALVVPTIDHELLPLAERRDTLLKIGAETVVSDRHFVSVCRDKRRTASFFQSRGIKVPRELVPEDLEFPVFAKPLNGSSGVGSFRAESPSDLPVGVASSPAYFFQEAIDRERFDEFTVDALYSSKGRLIEAVPRLRIETRAGEVSKSCTRRNRLCELLSTHLADIEGARGCLTMQFFLERAGDGVLGIEINARFGGGFPLTYRAGADFPGYLIAERLGLDVGIVPMQWEDGLMMLRYDSEVFLRA